MEKDHCRHYVIMQVPAMAGITDDQKIITHRRWERQLRGMGMRGARIEDGELVAEMAHVFTTRAPSPHLSVDGEEEELEVVVPGAVVGGPPANFDSTRHSAPAEECPT